MAETAEASKGRNVQLQQDLDGSFYGEPIELNGACKRVDHCRVDSSFRVAHRPGFCRGKAASCVDVAQNQMNHLFPS